MQELLNNLELSIKSAIDAGATGVATFIGQDDQNKTFPSVTIYAREGLERPIGSGNFLTSCTVTLRSNADDTSREVHRQRCNQIFGLLMNDALAATLSGLTGLHVFDPILNRQAAHSQEDDAWMSELSFDCYACISDMT